MHRGGQYLAALLATFPLKIRKAGTDASVQSANLFLPALEGVGSGFGISFGVGLPAGSGKRGTDVMVFLPRAIALGKVGPDMNEVVSDHRESNPATDAVRSFIE